MRAGRVQKVFTGPEGEVGRGWGEAWWRQVRRRLGSGFLSNVDDFPVPTYFAFKMLSVCCEWILKYMAHEIKTLIQCCSETFRISWLGTELGDSTFPTLSLG